MIWYSIISYNMVLWYYVVYHSMMAVGSRKLEYGPGKIKGDVPSSLFSGAGGQSYSNFLAFTYSGL